MQVLTNFRLVLRNLETSLKEEKKTKHAQLKVGNPQQVILNTSKVRKPHKISFPGFKEKKKKERRISSLLITEAKKREGENCSSRVNRRERLRSYTSLK